MKAKIIFINWLTSLAFLFTDSLIRALVVFCWFALSSLLLERNKKQAIAEANKLNKYIDKLIIKSHD